MSCQAAASRAPAPLRAGARAGAPASPAFAQTAPLRHISPVQHNGQLGASLARTCDRRRGAAAAAAGAPTTTALPAAADAPKVWDSFAAAVSGEWEGVTASFGPDGEPQQLPEYYVPEVGSAPPWPAACAAPPLPLPRQKRCPWLWGLAFPTTRCAGLAVG